MPKPTDCVWFVTSHTGVAADGFINAGQDVKVEITFHPKAADPDIRVERLRCRVLDASTAAAGVPAGGSGAGSGGAAAAPLGAGADLYLTLTGNCITSQAQQELVSFK